MEEVEPPELLAGDVMLYGVGKGFDLFGWITAIKTWSRAVHVEVYVGNGFAFASRNGLGVKRYPVRRDGLIAVLRPNQPMDLERGSSWFYQHADGQAYDWIGLLCFTLAVKQGHPRKMFCSEFATRFGRACGVAPFNPNFDADKIAPGNFFMSPAFEWVWKRPA